MTIGLHVEGERIVDSSVDAALQKLAEMRDGIQRILAAEPWQDARLRDSGILFAAARAEFEASQAAARLAALDCLTVATRECSQAESTLSLWDQLRLSWHDAGRMKTPTGSVATVVSARQSREQATEELRLVDAVGPVSEAIRALVLTAWDTGLQREAERNAWLAQPEVRQAQRQERDISRVERRLLAGDGDAAKALLTGGLQAALEDIIQRSPPGLGGLDPDSAEARELAQAMSHKLHNRGWPEPRIAEAIRQEFGYSMTEVYRPSAPANLGISPDMA